MSKVKSRGMKTASKGNTYVPIAAITGAIIAAAVLAPHRA